MAKYITQANDMATTANNWKTPGASVSGRHTTLRLLPVVDITKHDHLIHQHISHHIFTISHHNMPCKNKLGVLYFVVCKFYVAAMGFARTVLTYASKPQRFFIKCAILTFNKDRA